MKIAETKSAEIEECLYIVRFNCKNKKIHITSYFFPPSCNCRCVSSTLFFLFVHEKCVNVMKAISHDGTTTSCLCVKLSHGSNISYAYIYVHILSPKCFLIKCHHIWELFFLSLFFSEFKVQWAFFTFLQKGSTYLQLWILK